MVHPNFLIIISTKFTVLKNLKYNLNISISYDISLSMVLKEINFSITIVEELINLI